MSIRYENYVNMEAEFISKMLEENIRLQNILDDDKDKKVKVLTHQEKKLVLTELKDIKDITFTTNSGKVTAIVFHFKPISLYLDPGNRTGDVERRKLPFYYLWKLGFIDFKTSPSTVTMQILDNYNFNFRSIYEDDKKRNFHDWGLNCWGGWGPVIANLIKEKKFYDAVLHVASRMKQATVNDSVSSYERMCEFTYESKPYVFLNDQEFEFFKSEVIWLTSNSFDGTLPSIKTFRLNSENNTYYVDLEFRSINYRLAISPRSYASL